MCRLYRHPESQVKTRFVSFTEKTSLNKYRLSVVLGWREEGLQYLAENRDFDHDGILMIKKDNNIESFDLVLIDGSEFTGMAEFNDIYGAKIICLDDTDAFKCHAVRKKLLADPDYKLLAEDQQLRNGFSIFSRVDFACQPRAVEAVHEAMKSSRDWRKSGLRRVFRAIRRAIGR
jgi:hypothetical protein